MMIWPKLDASAEFDAKQFGEFDERIWRVGTNYGIHVYAVEPKGYADEPIATVVGEPMRARLLAEQIAAEHNRSVAARLSNRVSKQSVSDVMTDAMADAYRANRRAGDS